MATYICPAAAAFLLLPVAYEYGENRHLLKRTHDFEEDIIACAKNISKRYMGSLNRAETLEKITMSIFDCLKKKLGLTERDRLLLQARCTNRHDCLWRELHSDVPIIDMETGK